MRTPLGVPLHITGIAAYFPGSSRHQPSSSHRMRCHHLISDKGRKDMLLQSQRHSDTKPAALQPERAQQLPPTVGPFAAPYSSSDHHVCSENGQPQAAARSLHSAGRHGRACTARAARGAAPSAPPTHACAAATWAAVIAPPRQLPAVLNASPHMPLRALPTQREKNT